MFRVVLFIIAISLLIGCGDNFDASLVSSIVLDDPESNVVSSTQVKMQALFIVPEYPQRDYSEALEQIDVLIHEAQEFFANEMERHGYGRRTFEIDYDQNGKVRTTILYGDPEEEYIYSNSSNRQIDILHQHVNVTFSYTPIDICGFGDHINYTEQGKPFEVKNVWGSAIIAGFEHGCWNNYNVIHEIGHALGLSHDFISSTSVMSYNHASNYDISKAMAKQLSRHEAFGGPLYDNMPFDYHGRFIVGISGFESDYNNSVATISFMVDYDKAYKDLLINYDCASYISRDNPSGQPEEISFTEDMDIDIVGDKVRYTFRFSIDESIYSQLNEIRMKGVHIPIVDISPPYGY